MKILHLISGGETGGSKNHLLSLLKEFPKEEIILGVLQEGQLSREAVELGLPVKVFGQTSRYDMSVVKKMKQLIKEEDISLVHTHGPRANLYTYILRKQISFRWVTTVHSDPSKDFIKGGIKGRIFTWLNMTILKKIDAFFAVSERFKKMLIQFGIDGKKIHVIYNGIDFSIPLKENLTRKDLSLSDEDFVMVMVARLHPIKGHTLVFQALRQLIDSGKTSIKLLLVGDGPLREELQTEVRKLQIHEFVIFVGYQQDVHSYLSLADVKLLASYSESFPLVLLEAARAHTPIISTDVGGVRDMINSKDLGWIVPVGDITAMKEAIEEAFEKKADGTLYEIAENLYKKASSQYSVSQLYEATKEIYVIILN